MDNQAIEQTAVSTIERRVNLTDYLSSYLDQNDKTPSWDGAIYLFNNEHKVKDNMIGRISAQIKGHELKVGNEEELDQDDISFSINVADLKNYLNDGGAIYFVVYLRKNDKGTDFDTQPYYIELTPVRIMSILKECDYEQKSKAVQLKRLPDDSTKFASMVLNCYKNCKMQASFAGAELQSVEELQKQGVLKSLTFYVSGYGEENRNISAFLNADTYLYANVKGSAIPQPINIGEMREKVIKFETNAIVQINGTVYFDKIERILTETSATLRFGYGFSLEFNNNEPGCHFHYKVSNKMREFVTDTPFILAFIKTSKFFINDIPFDFQNIEYSFENFDVATQERNYSILSRCVEMLDIQGCMDDIDYTTLSDVDWRNLHHLTEATLDGKPIHGFSGQISPIMNMPVGSLNFAIGLTESSEEPGAYFLCNALDYSGQFTIGTENGIERIPIPICAIFKTDDLLKVSNIQFDRLLPSFKEFPINSYLYEVANDLMLRMISAYDLAQSGKKRRLLDTAQAFAEWLEEMPPEVWDRRIAILNKLQILKRRRPLSDEEKGILRGMIITTLDREDILFGANVLLENKAQAEYHFQKMPTKEQDTLRKYPIYFLVNKGTTYLLP